MHDPQTQALVIPYPWRKYGRSGRNDFERSYREPFITIWHVDPCRTNGRAVRSDDSCGWFMRAAHGDPEVLAKIVKRFEFDWDRTYTFDNQDKITFHGYFLPDGQRNMSRQGIALNLFLLAASVVFESDGRTNWAKSRRFLRKNLGDILLFAENPTDSLFFDPIHDHYLPTEYKREEQIHKIASCIYGWILRETRPWYKHPRWHIWHWRIQIQPLQQFKRWAFSRCCKCGKGFAWGYCPTTNNWNSIGPRWFRSETDTFHSSCDDPTNNNAQCEASRPEAADSVL